MKVTLCLNFKVFSINNKDTRVLNKARSWVTLDILEAPNIGNDCILLLQNHSYLTVGNLQLVQSSLDSGSLLIAIKLKHHLAIKNLVEIKNYTLPFFFIFINLKYILQQSGNQWNTWIFMKKNKTCWIYNPASLTSTFKARMLMNKTTICSLVTQVLHNVTKFTAHR